MKKQTILAAAIVTAALITGHLYAQDAPARNDVSVTRPAKPAPGISAANSKTPDNVGAASTISLRAIKDFKTRYTKVADEQWSRIDKGFAAFFTTDGFKVRAYYDPKGRWQASLKYCDESQLPRFIRDIVKRTYYDFAITNVVEIAVPEHQVWMITIEDKDTFKVVRVNDEGEMDVQHDYVKAN